jgi:hypothetical protein
MATDFHGANLRTLIDTHISLFKGDLSNYHDRNKMIDEIQERLMSDEFTAICLDNGTTYTKSFTPASKPISQQLKDIWK